jgi:hypothetical protein
VAPERWHRPERSTAFRPGFEPVDIGCELAQAFENLWSSEADRDGTTELWEKADNAIADLLEALFPDEPDRCTVCGSPNLAYSMFNRETGEIPLRLCRDCIPEVRRGLDTTFEDLFERLKKTMARHEYHNGQGPDFAHLPCRECGKAADDDIHKLEAQP